MFGQPRFLLNSTKCLLFTFVLVVTIVSSSIPTYASEGTVVVLLDDSGSMRYQMPSDRGKEAKMAVAKTALKRVVEQLPEGTKFGLLLMNGAKANQGWLIPLSPLDRDSALARIGKVEAEGGTPLGQSMKTAMDELLASRSKNPYGDYRLLVVTDGEATDKKVLDSFLPDMLSRGVIIDVIGVAMVSDHSLAKRTHSYRQANDAKSFQQALKEIFAESGGANDDGAAEYDLIAGLPDEFATETLKALTTVQNTQIGEVPSISNSVDSFTPSTPLGNTGSPAPANEKKGGNSFGFMVAIVLLILIVFSGLMKSKRRR